MVYNKRPLISIITVVLNGAKTIETTVLSVVEQKFSDYEYIIIDGCSTDGTLDIIRKYDRHISYWVSEPDNGVYDAMNKAVKLARGDWVYFLGADDLLICELATIADYLKDKDTLYYGDVYRPVINRIFDGRFSSYKLACRNICQQSIFYPRTIFSKYSFKLKYPILSDHEFNMRCFANPGIFTKYIQLTIAEFTDKGGLSSSSIDNEFENDRMKLVKKYFPYHIYIVTLIRFQFIKLLSHMKLISLANKLHRFLLRLAQKSLR